MHSSFRRTSVALSIPAVLLLTACSDDGLGDTDALSGVDLHFTDEGTPEVILRSPLELEEEASRVLDRGDGEDLDEEQILEVSHAVADPSSGEIQEESFSEGEPSMIFLPQMQEQSEFIYDSLTDTELTVGSEIALFEPANAETGAQATLLVLRVEGQSPAHAAGEVQEQDGELPEIENEEGVLPELIGGNEGEEPEEVSTEVLIQGDGEEVAADDQVVVRYSGWKWSDGELFDSNWPQEDDEAENEAAVGPNGFPLSNLVPGWAEGLEGEQVGSRVLLVIPPESGYGESDEDAEEGTEHELAGETLIFVVDLIASAEAPQAAPAPAPEGQPELSEEDIEEMIEQMEAEQGGAEGAEEGTEGADADADAENTDAENTDAENEEESD